MTSSGSGSPPVLIPLLPTNVTTTLAPQHALGADEAWDVQAQFSNDWRNPDGTRILPRDVAGQGSGDLGSITIPVSGPVRVLDPAAASLFDVTQDRPCALSIAPTAGKTRLTLLLRGPFLPTFGPEGTFVQGSAITAAIGVAFAEITFTSSDGFVTWQARTDYAPVVAPSAPGFVSANPTGATTATVGWSRPASDGGNSTLTYTVTARVTSTNTVVGSPHTGISALTYALTGLTAVSHTIEVFATNGAGFVGPSSYAIVTPAVTSAVPSVILNAVATPGDTTATLTFADPLSGLPLTNFSATITAAGGGATVPAAVHAPVVTTATTTAPSGSERQWTTKATSAGGAHGVTSNAFTVAPLAGSGLIAFITHGSNGQNNTVAPTGFILRARGMDATGNVTGSGGASNMVEIWEKPYTAVDGTETGGLVWTYDGNASTFTVMVVEVVGLGNWRGGSGTVATIGGVSVAVHQVNGEFPATSIAHNSGSTPSGLPPLDSYAAAVFLGGNQDVVSFDSTFVEHAPVASPGQNAHVATRTITGSTGGVNTTMGSGGAYNVGSSVGLWDTRPGGIKMSPTWTAAAAGSKLIVTLHHKGDGRTTTGPAGWSLINQVESATGPHVEVWRKNAVGGETTGDWIISGSGTGLAPVLTFREWKGVGANDPTVATFPSPTLAGTQIDVGPASIPINSLVYLVGTVSVDQTVTGWSSGTFTEDVTSGCAHLGSRIMASSTTVDTLLTWVTAADAVAMMLVWAPAPAGYTATVATADATVHTISFPGPLANGVTHTIVAHAINSTGPGQDVTLTVTPTATVVAPSGGVATLRARLGTSAESQVDVTSTTNSWNVLAAPTSTPISWRWATHTGVDTANAGDAAGFQRLLTNSGFVGAPVSVQRIGQYDGGQYTLAQINAGVADAHIDAYGVVLQQITVAQGNVPQWIRPLSEGDGNWQAWKIDPLNIGAYTTAVRRIIARVKAKCPTILVTLTFDFGVGGGVGAKYLTHAHDIWDLVMADLGGKAFGGLIDCVDIDAYSDGTPKVDTNTGLDGNGVAYNVNGHTWLYNEQQMYLARCLVWGVQTGNSEWGVGDRGGVIPAANGAINYAADEYALAWCVFWASLPATGPGSLGHIELFDGSVYPPVGQPGAKLPDGRGVIHVPDPVNAPDGLKVAGAIKTYLV